MNRVTVASLILLLSSASGFAQTTTPAPATTVPATTAPATTAAAPTTTAQKQHVDPCIDDVHKYCKGIEPGMGRIAFCLFDNRPKLSPICQRIVQHFYDIDTNLAAKAHEPLKQFLLEAYARRAHNEYVRSLNAKDKAPAKPSGAEPAGTTPAPSGQSPATTSAPPH